MRSSIWKTMFCLILMMFFILSSIETVIGENVETKKQDSKEEKINMKYVPGEVIVGFHSCIPPNADVLITQHGGTIIKRDDTLHFVLVKVSDTDKFIEEIKYSPSIRYTEYNGYVYATTFPNDPLFWDPHNESFPDSKQWGPQKIGAPQAWDVSTGSSTATIAILDTGIDYTHRELRGNLWHNVDEIPYNKLDDDSNGYVDDYIGWNFAYDHPEDHNKKYKPTDPMDDNIAVGHGTHVAGIAGAVIDNGIGIAGIAQPQLMALKVLDSDGNAYKDATGTWTDVIEAIEYAVDNGANIVSMSFSTFDYSSASEDACNYAWDQGVLLVAASGNDIESNIAYPAAFDSVIAVGATDENDIRASWSNYGSKLELVAPGVNIVSSYTHEPYDWELPSDVFYHDGDRYIILSGTSMATPHVSGVAALVWSRNPYLTNQQVRDILRNTADDLVYTRGNEVATQGWDQYTGYGRVNVSKAAGDDISPTISSFLINNDDDHTNRRDVSLGVSASDTGLDVYQMRFSNSNSPYWHNKFREIESSHGCGWNGKLYVLDPFDPAGVVIDDVSHPGNVTESDHPYTSTGDTYTWHIQSTNPYHHIRMRIGFGRMELAFRDYGWKQVADVLRVYDQNGNLVNIWYGDGSSHENVWTGYLSGNSATIELETRNCGSAWGFYAETYNYKTASGGNYPNDYSKEWYIADNDRTKIHFEYIDTDADVDDEVIIYDSVGSSADAVYYGYHQDVWTQELYGDVKIQFFSDSSLTDKGFRIDYYKEYVGYPRGYNNWWVIREPGALEMRVHFTKIETCSGDNIHIYDKDNTHIESYSGSYSDLWTSSVSGDTINIRFVANNDYNTAWGFKIDKYQYWDYPWSAWEPYNTIKDSWTLTSIDGEKTVYCQVEDYAGNVAGVHPNLVSDTIILDTIADPPNVSSSTHPNQDKWYSHNDPKFNWTAPSDLSGIQGYYYILDQNSNTIPTPSTGTWTTDTSKTFYGVEDGVWYFHIVSKDNASNVGTTANHSRVLIDVTPPTDSYIYINNDTEYTNSTAVTLNISSSDTHSDIDKMRFKNEDEAWTSWEPCNTTKEWTLSSGDGRKTVYYQSKDTAGNTAASVCDTIILDTTPPSPVEDAASKLSDDLNNITLTWDHRFPSRDNATSITLGFGTVVGGSVEDIHVNNGICHKIEEGVLVRDWIEEPDRDVILSIIYNIPLSSDGNHWRFCIDAYISTYYNDDFEFHYKNPSTGDWEYMFTMTDSWFDSNTEPHSFTFPADTFAGCDYAYIRIKDTNIERDDLEAPVFKDVISIDRMYILTKNFDHCNIYRKNENDDAYTFINSVPADTKTWTDVGGGTNFNKYSYMVKTVDRAGNLGGGLVPPTLVQLYNPTSITSNSMELEWTQNNDIDFKRYELHKSTTSNFTLDFTSNSTTLYKSSTNRSWTEETVSGLSPSTKYYFKVAVFNANDLCAISNEVNNTTASSSTGGCPYVYVWDGIDYIQDNTILPESKDSDRQERIVTDYYRLEETLVPKDGEYSMIIKEVEREHTNLDQLQLITIDHSNNVHAAIAQNGTVLTYKDPLEPISVVDRYGDDRLSSINTVDGGYYEGFKNDYLVIDFGKTNTINGAKLVIRADMIAYRYKIHSLPSTIPSELGPVKIQLYTSSHTWKDITSIVPRDKWAIDIIDLYPHLQDIGDENLKIRVRWEAHHKLDYVGLDISPEENVSVETYSVISAVHSTLGDVKNKLLYRDDNDVKISTGEEVTVTFPYTPKDNDTRDIVLVSKGHYYYIINDVGVSQNVKVNLNVDGTIGNTVEMIIIESSISRGYFFAPITSTPLTVAQGGNSANTTFKAYANRSYQILLRYKANYDGMNPVNIQLEYNDHLKIKNVTFDALEGVIQEKYVLIDSDLHEVLCPSLFGMVMANCGTVLNFEPGNLMEDNDIFGWENIEWDFGDGTILSTTNRTVTHEYEAPGGMYTMTVTVTYEDGAIVTRTKEIWVGLGY